MKNKIKVILIASLVFVFLEVIAFLGLYFVWTTAPQENLLWLENNYKGFFKYAIMGCFTFSVTGCNYFNSIKIAKGIK